MIVIFLRQSGTTIIGLHARWFGVSYTSPPELSPSIRFSAVYNISAGKIEACRKSEIQFLAWFDGDRGAQITDALIRTNSRDQSLFIRQNVDRKNLLVRKGVFMILRNAMGFRETFGFVVRSTQLRS
jgi:hypothetical protein